MKNEIKPDIINNLDSEKFHQNRVGFYTDPLNIYSIVVHVG